MIFRDDAGQWWNEFAARECDNQHNVKEVADWIPERSDNIANEQRRPRRVKKLNEK